MSAEREARQASEQLWQSVTSAKDAVLAEVRGELAAARVQLDQLRDGEIDLKEGIARYQATKRDLRAAMAAASS